nr:hypothetical protein CFP56_50859 [Quercus suber]
MPPLELMGDLPVPAIEPQAIVDPAPSLDDPPPLVRRRSASAPTPAARLVPSADLPTVDVPVQEATTKDFPTDDMPGAFPTEEQGRAENEPEREPEKQANAAQSTTITNTEEHPEPKANAAEMAQYKRLPQVPQDLQSVHSQEQMASAPEESDRTEPEPEHSDPNPVEATQHQSLVGSAIAGASAVVAATAVAVSTAFGTTDTKDNQEFDKVQDSSDATSLEVPDRQETLADMETSADAPMFSAPPTSSENLSSGPTSRKVSPDRVETPLPSTNVREASADSYTLGGEDPGTTPVATNLPKKRSSMSGNMLSASTRIREGIAAGRVSAERTRSSSPAVSDAEQQAKGASRGSSRLYLGSLLEDNPAKDDLQLSESPTQSESPADTSDESGEQLQANSSLNDSREHMGISKALQPALSTRSSFVQTGGRRSSVPGSALTSSLNTLSIPEKSSRRQSRNAALDKLEGRVTAEDEASANAHTSSSLAMSGYDAPRSRLAMGPQVDGQHGAGQRANRGSKRWSDNADLMIPVAMTGLTSANIRGPEDFDLFVPNDDGDSVGDGEDMVQSPAQYHDPSPRQPVPSTSADFPQSSSRSSLPPASQQTREETRAGRSQTSKQVTSAAPESRANQTSLKDKRRSVSRPPQRNTSVHKSGLMAREPRVMTESTRDFADFIRSTGPQKEPVVVPLLSPANRSTTSLHSLRSAHINGSRASLVERRKSLTKSTMDAQNIPPVPVIPPGTSGSNRVGRWSVQPRGATTQHAGYSDFIDFIRSGPADPGQHRISRTVAPFRSTMDSDQLNDMGRRINGSAPLDLTLNTNFGAIRGSDRYSVVSPMSSDPSPQLVHPAHSGGPPRLSGVVPNLDSPVNGEPGKKRSRIKDPYAAYALDLEDDDDDHLTALPNGNSNPRQEESLADFLKSSDMAASTKDFISHPTGDATHQPVLSPESMKAGFYHTGTSELAEFLRSSGPVDDSRSAPAPVVSNQRRQSVAESKATQKKGGFFSVLTRARTNRSAAAKNTYLDLRWKFFLLSHGTERKGLFELKKEEGRRFLGSLVGPVMNGGRETELKSRMWVAWRKDGDDDGY